MARSDGARRFKALMAALPVELRKQIGQEIAKQANALVSVQKRAVPKDKGALRDSIRAEVTAGRTLSISVKAGGPKTTRPVRKGQKATYDYALGQEFGNRRTRAQPFFFPSYRLKKPAIRRGIGKVVKTTIQTATRRG